MARKKAGLVSIGETLFSTPLSKIKPSFEEPQIVKPALVSTASDPARAHDRRLADGRVMIDRVPTRMMQDDGGEYLCAPTFCGFAGTGHCQLCGFARKELEPGAWRFGVL